MSLAVIWFASNKMWISGLQDASTGKGVHCQA